MGCCSIRSYDLLTKDVSILFSGHKSLDVYPGPDNSLLFIDKDGTVL